MSARSHTPGPWHADTRERYTCGGDCVEITLHDNKGYVIDQIASVMLETGDDTTSDRKRYKRQEADALLIAAAPDLLSALEALVKEIRAYGSPECDDKGAIGAAELKAADAAIAKAKGAP